MGKNSEALPELERAIALQPNLGEADYQLGQVYTRLGQKKKAATAFAAFKKYHGTEETGRREVLDQIRQSLGDTRFSKTSIFAEVLLCQFRV